MYGQGTQAAGHRWSGGRAHRRRERGRERGDSRRERVRLIQLAVCLALFLTVFVGKGVFPGKLVRLQGEIQSMISADFDFRGALAGLGGSLAESGTVLSDLGEFCVQVFGGEVAPEAEEVAELQPIQPSAVLTSQLRFISGNPDGSQRAEHFSNLADLGLDVPLRKVEEAPAPAAEEVQAVPAAGTVLLVSDYDGQPLPENYTMDQISLGELETVTPVLGHLNSTYGYRDHPIDGRYQFHGGVDIGGQMGDPIAAFAAGTVEYTGKDDSYGLYFQIDHGNGVKSFYAHCSEVLVTKGQTVAMGETVARVGSSGSATGPHLHLELKYGKMHLDPAYYVEFLVG